MNGSILIEFQQTANGKVHIDFKDELALRTLTLCLLKRDFNLTVELPPEQLVPTLPLRLNYILWIEDILNTFELSDVIGLDIGEFYLKINMYKFFLILLLHLVRLWSVMYLSVAGNKKESELAHVWH